MRVRPILMRCSVVLGVLACAGAPDSLELPDDSSERGFPVGVRTVTYEGRTFEVWYPAAQAEAGGEAALVDLSDAVPEVVVALLDGLSLAVLEPGAIRDVAMRRRPDEARWPIVIFSHGFGGTRNQSVDLTVHLASRGYVVVATDHVGRSLTELIPCLFTSTASSCSLSFEDSGVRDVPVLLDWLDRANTLETHPLYAAIDTERIALMGHSAGGGTTVSVGEASDRFSALLPLAGGGVTSGATPTMRMVGGCDGIVRTEGERGQRATHNASTGEVWMNLPGAGHLAFSDLCTIDLGAVAQEKLVGRDDLNTLFFEQLLGLAVDGCPGYPPAVTQPACEAGFSDLEDDQALIREAATRFLDAHVGGASLDLGGIRTRGVEIALP